MVTAIPCKGLFLPYRATGVVPRSGMQSTSSSRLDREPEKCTLAVRMFACKRTPLRGRMACHPNSPLHLTPFQVPFLGRRFNNEVQL